MTFDLLAFPAAHELDLAEARDVYTAICEGQPLQKLVAEHERVNASLSQLTSKFKWPELSSSDEEGQEDSPWAGGALVRRGARSRKASSVVE
jgi:hypothetical protein